MKSTSAPVGVNVRMGELALAHEGQLLTLLGSCVGIALYDRRRKIGGLAHAVLPASHGDTDMPGKFVDTAIAKLLAGLSDGVVSDGLVAKLAGGANMFNSDSDAAIGAQNVAAAEEILTELGIAIVGRHCGGSQGRRVAFDIATGTVAVQQVGLSDRIEI